MLRSFLLFLVVVVRVPVANCQKAIGDVIEVRGDWRLANASSALLAGEGVPAGSVIKAPNPQRNDFLVVVLLNGVRLAARCDETPCTPSLKIPEAYVNSSVSVQKVLDAVKFVLVNRREAITNAFVSSSSRGLFDEHREDVASLEEGNTISFTPAQLAPPEGSFRLELADAASAHFLHGQDVEIKAQGEPIRVSVPGPGNYLLRFKNSLDNLVLDMFVAVPMAKDHDKIEKSFEQAKEICAQWGPAALDSSHYFLRAYLLSLVNQP
jgi:hypothetical protein